MASASDIEAVDLNDPCALHTALRATYLRVIAGQAETRIRFRNGEDEEDVMYGVADKEALRIEIAKQEALCKAKTDARPTRFAFTAG